MSAQARICPETGEYAAWNLWPFESGLSFCSGCSSHDETSHPKVTVDDLKKVMTEALDVMDGKANAVDLFRGDETQLNSFMVLLKRVHANTVEGGEDLGPK